jgi:hypothetical protein
MAILAVATLSLSCAVALGLTSSSLAWAKTHSASHSAKTHKNAGKGRKTGSSQTGSQAGTMELSGPISGSGKLVNSETVTDVVCFGVPTIQIALPVSGYMLYIDPTLAKPGKRTNLRTSGGEPASSAVSIYGPRGDRWESGDPGTSGTVTVNAAKGGSINATLASTNPDGGPGEHVSGTWKCA